MALLASPLPKAAESAQDAVDRSTLRNALRAARERWDSRRPANYEFVLSIPDGLDWWSRRFASYRVTSGSRVTLAPVSGRMAATFAGLDSIDALFDLIGERLNTAPSPVFVLYDDVLGYPANASLGDVSFNLPTFRPFSSIGDVADPFVQLQHVNHCGALKTDRRGTSVCPDYSIAIWGDGTVVYVGSWGVRTVGRRQHRVSQDEVQRLVKSIEVSGFVDLAQEYRSISLGNGVVTTIGHTPERWLTIRTGGQQKTVHDFYGAPVALTILESTIEDIADSRRYTGREPGLPTLRERPRR